MRVLKRAFQFVDLELREDGAMSSLLPLAGLVRRLLHVVAAMMHECGRVVADTRTSCKYNRNCPLSGNSIARGRCRFEE